MTKAIIVKDLSNTLNIKGSRASIIVDAVLAELKNGLVDDGKVIIRKFGTFRVLDKKERIGRNPKTKEPATITARSVATFKASKLLKTRVD
jgi:integration host factor subunit alpha